MPLPQPQLSESIQSLNLSTPPKLHLYTASTPNGVKISIFLEELLLAYPQLAKGPLSYDFTALTFSKKEQKDPEFLEINPNGRIPALVDDNVLGRDGKGHKVFETGSILIWLAENYDDENKFWFTDPIMRSEAMSLMMFIMAGVGPMQGQSNHFYRYAPEKIPYAIERYQTETSRLYSVLESVLKKGKGEYLIGDKYTIVDINAFGWVRKHDYAGVDISPYPLLKAWLDRIEERPGVYAGVGIPTRAKKVMTEEEMAKEAKEGSKWILDGMKKA